MPPDIDFKALIEPVARLLCGEPNERLSSKKILRFGTNGSLSIDLEKAVFFDHELPDNDDAGRDHVFKVAAALKGIAAHMWILQLPGLGPKEDVSDWIERGGTLDQFNALLDQAQRIDEVPSDSSVDVTPRVEEWPQPLGADAYHGIVGEIVRAIAPNTEADPVAILLQLLAAFGNVCGRNCYYKVEGDRHPAVIWPVLVGPTAKGRKGSSWSRVREVIALIDKGWAGARIKTGISSGEGIVHEVRDERVGDDGKVEDKGADDKRLLLIESEFATALRHMERTGNILSPTLRTLWDNGNSANLTKQSPEGTTEATVTVVGHITVEEIRRYLTRTEMANGLANRFLFALVRRSKLLPLGGEVIDFEPFVARLKEAHSRAWPSDQRFTWTPDGAKLWESVYGDLSEGRAGLLGAVTSRAETQVVRLALAYALLDSASAIDVAHLNAALAVWRYCEQSARIIFGSRTGNQLADEILDKLKLAADGMSRKQISDALGRHQKSEAIEAALQELKVAGMARPVSRQTGGRPEERWFGNK